MSPEYRCTACGAKWTYAAVRHLARCRHCQSGLTRIVQAATREAPPPAGRAAAP